MKHNLKITLILLAMFLITQLIGLAVINAYSTVDLPYGMQPPENIEPVKGSSSLVFAFIVAMLLFFLLMKFKLKTVLRLWFFIVVIVALAITFNTLLSSLNLPHPTYLALIISLPLAFYKTFKRHLIIHNITELLIYPGIAAVFVAILSQWGFAMGVGVTVSLLLFISVYDIYAVWHSGFMQKMAKFQIEHLKIFAGFFVPYLSRRQRLKLKKLKKARRKKVKEKKIRVSLAVLGGGDVVFPLILAGVVLRTLDLLPALMISVFATLGLLYLFMKAEKGKFYPAMPFITVGCLAGLAVSYLLV